MLPAVVVSESSRQEPRAAASQSLFRAAALEAIEDDHRHGQPLLIVSLWTRLTVVVVAIVALAGLAFVALVPIPELAEGVAVVAAGEDGPRISILFPGRVRPLFDEHTPVFVELDGFPESRVAVELETIADALIEVEAPPELAGQAAFVVEARLPRASFESRGRERRIFVGMRGRAEAELRRTTILELLIPDLRRR